MFPTTKSYPDSYLMTFQYPNPFHMVDTRYFCALILFYECVKCDL